MTRGLFPVLLVLSLLVLLVFGGCERSENYDPSSDTDRGFSDLDDDRDENSKQPGSISNGIGSPFLPRVAGCESGAQLTYVLGEQRHTIPFPTDLLTTQDSASPTGRRLAVHPESISYLEKILDTYAFLYPALDRLDGFGTSTALFFPANRPPNGSLLPDGTDPSGQDAVFCVVLEDTDHPVSGVFWPLQAQWVEHRKLIKVTPHLPFFENTAYGCVVTDRLLTQENDCYETSDHMKYILADAPNPAHDHAVILEPYRQALRPWVDRLVSQTGIEIRNIRSATFFTTQYTTHDLMSMVEQLEQMAASDPPVTGDWTRLETSRTNLDSIWETTYETVNWRKNGVVVTDAQGDPVPQGTETITLRLNLPEKGINGYEQPYPIVIFGHGTNDSRNSSSSMGSHVAPYGFATVGIDWVWHGARSGSLDGMDPTLATILRSLRFYNVFQPRKFRDNMRQGAADITWLKHVIRELSELDLLPYETGGDGIPDLDTESLSFFGMSLGGLHGELVAAAEPDIDAFLFNCAAAKFRTVAFESDVGSMLLSILELLETLLSFNISDDLFMATDFILTIVDAGDPYNYGQYVHDYPLYDPPGRLPDLLLQMAAYDNTVGGPGSAQMARSLDLVQLAPMVWPIEGLEQGTAPFEGPAVYQYDTDEHNLFFWGDVAEGARVQAGTFFRTSLDNGQATVIDPFARK